MPGVRLTRAEQMECRNLGRMRILAPNCTVPSLSAIKPAVSTLFQIWICVYWFWRFCYNLGLVTVDIKKFADDTSVPNLKLEILFCPCVKCGCNKIFLPITNVIHQIIGGNVSQYEYRRESNRIYMSTDGTKAKSWMKRSIGNPKHYPYAPILRPLPPSSRKGHIGTTRCKNHPRLARARYLLVKPKEIITKMSRKLFFLLSPSAVLFYFLFTVRVPHKKTINLLFTDHQEIVSRRGLFTTHVRLVARESKWCTLYDWRATKMLANDTFYLP